MRRCQVILVIWVVTECALLLSAQTLPQTGVIRGFFTDKANNPLPGAAVEASGPALMGTQTDITRSDGSFRLPNLPPGLYSVRIELAGFKVVRQDDIRVQTGAVVTIQLQTEPSPLKEQVLVKAASPAVDVHSSKISEVIPAEMLGRLPLNRNFVDMFETIPGAAGTIDTYSGSIHGATPTNVSFELDGINLNSPSHGGLMLDPQYDAIEEVEIVTGSLPPQVGNSGGSYVNIVSKSGGNTFHGHAQVFYTGGRLTKTLFTEQQLKDLGVGEPQSPIFDTDLSASLGGPILRDKFWFFLAAGTNRSEIPSLFIPTTIQGKFYDQYNIPETVWRGLLKFTVQFTKSLRFFGMAHGELLNCDVFNIWDTQRTYDSRFTLRENTKAAATGNLTWLVNKNTYLDVRAGYVNHWYPITADPASASETAYTDGFTGYTWNAISSWESFITRRTWQTSVRVTHFMDDVLGGSHELGAGVEAVWGLDRYGYARLNPLTWWYYDGNPYYYRGFYGLDGAHPQFGDGRLQFTNCGSGQNDSVKELNVNRWGGYVQDAFTVNQRLTIQAGLRFDITNGYMGMAVTTGTTGLPFEIGQSVVEPVLGFNPFGPFELSPIRDVISFVTVDPRIGLIWDPFGHGRSALKLSYSRYSEQLPVWRFSGVSPDVLANYNFHWWDLDGNGHPDPPGIDDYAPLGGFGQFSLPDPGYLRSRVDPDLTAPSYHEIVASFSHELFRNFILKAQYLYKRGQDLHGSVLYDRESGRFWYNLDSARELYVPFTTVVPACDEFPEERVTVYFFSQDSPYSNRFFLQTNIPESKREYHGFEMSFNKRFSAGWSLAGSIVLSQHKSFMSSDSPYKRRVPGGSPNDFVNGYGRDAWDQPLVIKLFGTFDLPFGLMGSFFYSHASGVPFARTVTIVPPASWAAASNAVPWNAWVLLETIGTRRQPSINNVDIRLEKRFETPVGRLGFFADVYNALGNKYITYGRDPGGVWRPADAGGSDGIFTPDWSYGRALSIQGTRIFKLSVRFSF